MDEDPGPAGSHESADRRESPMSGRQVVMLLAVVLGAIVISQTLLRRPPPGGGPGPADPAEAGVVVLAIDRGDGPPSEGAVAWREGLTALGALELAPMGWPGEVRRRGEGAQAFVDAIGGLENEGAGGRNWQYWVNDERAEVSAGAKVLQKGDRVLWAFAPAE